MKYCFFIAMQILGLDLKAQNTNLDSLISQTQWDSLFPKRAGMSAGHPQGYTADFYSFANLKQAVNDLSDYKVTIRKKIGVWGELTTVTRKSTNITYNYSDVDATWHSNTTPETIINVDFKDFINRLSSINNKRELSAFLANISKETTGGWQTPIGGGSPGDYAKWGLYFGYEVGYTPANSAGAYSQAHTEYPPNASKGYYGRGPIQLSWNYNYGQFSKFIFNDKTILLNNPDTIQKDGVLAFKSAIWFWMMPQCPKPSCHQVMHELWAPVVGEYSSSKMYKKGFAHTNNIINGGLECRTSSSTAFTAKVVLRSELYKYYLGIAGFNTTQIASENTGNKTSLCYESTTDAMQDFINCAIAACTPTYSNRVKTICSNQTYFYNNQMRNLTGNYNDTFVNSNGCDSIETLTLIINQVKNTNINQSICQGDSFIFNNQYNKIAGIYFDTLLSDNMCDSIIKLILSIKPNAQSTVYKEICQGDSFLFNNQYYKLSGTYQAKYKNQQGCDSIENLILTINSLPVISINQSNSQLIAKEGFTSYRWFFNSTPLSATSNIYQANQTGTYSVEVENASGCKNKTSIFYTHYQLSTIYLTDNQIKIYPSPTSGIINLNGLKQLTLAKVYDILGHKLLEIIVKNKLDLSSLSNGFYWVEISNKREKILVEK